MADGILILEGRFGERDVRFEVHEDVVVLGRAPDCDLVVPEPAVSRRHAEIRREGTGFVLRDLRSSNGTRLNDVLVKEPVLLQPGDRIALAKAELTVMVPLGAVDATRDTGLTYVDSSPSTNAEVSWREIEDLSGPRLDRRDRLFKVMLETGELMSSAKSPEALYEPILDLVEAAFTPERALLLLRGGPDEEPKVAAARVDRGPRRSDDIVMSRTVVRRVLNEKVSLLIEDPGLFDSASAMQSIVAQGIRAGMAVPLVDEGRVTGLLYADTTALAVRYNRDDLKAFTLLASVIGTALTHARYHAMEKEKQRLDAELDTARGILSSILPKTLPELPGYELCAHLESCYEVGGDLYDLLPLDDGRLLVVAGDVSGKGLGAALLVSSIIPLLRTLVETDRDPVALVVRLNRHLWRTTDPIRFATIFLGLLNPETGRLDYVNAGHNPPFLLTRDGELRPLKATGPPVGMVEDFDFGAAAVELEAGASLILYSDGISEAGSDEADFYGEGRFEAKLRELTGRSAEDILTAALEDLDTFLDGTPPDDDITLVLLQRT